MKTYIVSGAASGIGHQITIDLLKEGSQVAVIDVKPLPESLKGAESDGRLIYFQGDCSSEKDVQTLVRQVRERWQRLDGLVNNAGFMIRKALKELSLEEWQRVLDTNLTSVFLFARETQDLLAKHKGSVINICSTRATQSEANTESYSATKGAILALTHSLAISLGPDIRVNCISPGWIDVRSEADKKKEPLKKSDHEQHPVGRVGQAEDISSFVQFLFGPGSGFITGQEFVIDGGMSKKMIYEE